MKNVLQTLCLVGLMAAMTMPNASAADLGTPESGGIFLNTPGGVNLDTDSDIDVDPKGYEILDAEVESNGIDVELNVYSDGKVEFEFDSY